MVPTRPAVGYTGAGLLSLVCNFVSVRAFRHVNHAKNTSPAIIRICTTKCLARQIMFTIANIWRAKNIGVQIRMMAGDVFFVWMVCPCPCADYGQTCECLPLEHSISVSGVVRLPTPATGVGVRFNIADEAIHTRKSVC